MSPIFTKFALEISNKLQNYDEQNRIQYLGDILILIGMVILGSAVASYLSLFLISLVFKLDFNVIKDMVFNLDDPNQVQALRVHNALSAFGTWFFSAWFFVYFKRWSFKNFVGMVMPRKQTDWIFSLLIFMGSFFASAFLIQVNANLPFFQTLNEQTKDITSSKILSSMLEMNSMRDMLMNVFFLALVPAVFEEIFFRGILQNLMIRATGNVHLGIAFTSLLFAAIHLNPLQFLPMLFLAAMLGYAYHYSGAIWVSMLIHFINNAVAVMFSFYSESSDFAKHVMEDKYMPPVVLIILGFVTCFFLLYRMSKNEIKVENE